MLELASPLHSVTFSLHNVSFCGTVQLQSVPFNSIANVIKGVEVYITQTSARSADFPFESPQVSLISRPDLDFELGGAAAIMEMTGLHQLLR